MKALILGAGQIHDYSRVRGLVGAPDLVICADGGLRHALAMELTPDLLLGDFDSLDPELVAGAAARGIPVTKLPAEKDQTDTHLALDEAIRRGTTEVILAGATGDRLDHTLSTLLLLPKLPQRVGVQVVDGKNLVQLLGPGGRLTLRGEPGQFLSLLPLSPEVKGLVAEGVKWPLDGATLRWGESVGVSNEIVEDEAFIAVREGYLLVIQSRD